MGLMGTPILAMYNGWPIVLMSPLHFVQQPRRWLQAISDYRVMTTVGPNFSLDLCAEVLIDEEIDGLDLSSVQQLYCGAEPIHAETQARFLRTAAPFGFDPKALIPCYGMAEATLFISGKRSDFRYGTAREPEGSGNGRTVVSCGDVDSEHAVRVVDPATCASLDEGAVGEIWVSGRSVAAGYYNRPDVTREVFHARLPGDEREYLRTGDLGFMRSGELFVTGRIKDLIIVDGRNIYPQDVEAAVVRTDPAFRKAVAFSIDGDSTEQLCVVVEAGYMDVTPQLHSTMVDTIRRGVTSEFGVRPHVHICPTRTIPITTSGKVRRQEARRMFLANALRPLQIDPLPRREAVG
jgi:acyl-CoA synthetase (AMP-forming)/AMP-acid ligase II